MVLLDLELQMGGVGKVCVRYLRADSEVLWPHHKVLKFGFLAANGISFSKWKKVVPKMEPNCPSLVEILANIYSSHCIFQLY